MTPYEEWSTGWLGALDVLARPGHHLDRSETVPPLSAAELERVSIDLLRLGYDPNSPDPFATAVARLRSRLATAEANDAAGALVRTLGALTSQIAAALDAAPAARGPFIRSADFGTGGAWKTPPSGRNEPHALQLCVVRLAELPHNHWIRTVMPADDFLMASGSPELILGYGRHDVPVRGVRRPWYFAHASFALTQRFREDERYEERQKREEQERRDAAERDRLRHDTHHRVARLEAELAALKAERAAQTVTAGSA